MTSCSPANAGLRAGLLGLALIFTACSAKPLVTPADYMEIARDAVKSEDYEFAIQHYEKLLEEFPFSDYTEAAQIEIAFAYYSDARYPESIAAFQDFRRMYPTSERIPFAEYHVGMAYMHQMGSKERDQRASQNAHYHFKALIDRYPDDVYADRARESLEDCRDALAEHELYVAQFYITWKNYAGADSRLLHLLQNYGDTKVAPEALVSFARNFRKRGDPVRAGLSYASILERYPDSEQSRVASQRLAALALEPSLIGDEPMSALMKSLVRDMPAEVAGEHMTPSSS